MWIGPARDLALRIVLRLLQMLLDHPHAFDQDALFARDHFEHLPDEPVKFPEMTSTLSPFGREA